MDYAYALLDKGYVPDMALRPVIRQLCRKRLREIDHGSLTANHAAKMAFIQDLSSRPIAIDQQKANEQHYEVPTSFLQLCLGPRMKYSSCLWPGPTSSLADAEDAILSGYCSEAKLGLGLRGVGNIQDGGEVGKEGEGLRILDLGCGWGSLGLFLAEHYPLAKITMLSNSKTQKVFIDSVAKEKGFGNVEVITGDVNIYDFEDKGLFTHILSIEMFEHMKAYPTLFRKISTWLSPKGLLFIHIFCHRDTPYHFEENDGWMAQTFFSGGTMPSLDLFTYFQRDLTLLHSSYLDGTHYARTLEAWLVNQDKHAKEAKRVLVQAMGEDMGMKTFYRFRVFFMACAEFFAMDKGETWGIGKYLFENK
ncbi:S-adenosyl-L-methionine-dependent methyltransferase [Naematelia encephala]|uniref:S-adenosyl-L-methionine-dependent methyltransferase n=1 Tax=Naematelia encephala TaxID=71784 RepID=A0A1Y2BEJ2_9TREE|nr:S-adenosyl-L-methionine-dependent methyltransferase [Naematelia encephala]